MAAPVVACTIGMKTPITSIVSRIVASAAKLGAALRPSERIASRAKKPSFMSGRPSRARPASASASRAARRAMRAARAASASASACAASSARAAMLRCVMRPASTAIVSGATGASLRRRAANSRVDSSLA